MEERGRKKNINFLKGFLEVSGQIHKGSCGLEIYDLSLTE